MRHTTIIYRCLAFAASALLVFTLSCSRRNEQESLPAENAAEARGHFWYYFAADGYHKTDLPQNAPQTMFAPWTESVRVSAAMQGAQSFFLVNRCGMLRFEKNAGETEPFRLFGDKSIFAGTTAENLFIVDGEPVFNAYRSSFFNSGELSQSPFLVQFRPDTGFFIPVLSVTDLGMSAVSQPVSVTYDGKNWAAAFKTVQGEKVAFNYLRFYAYEPLLPLLPADRKSVLIKEDISADLFKELNAQKKFTESPKALQQLLEQLPKSLSFQVECSAADWKAPRIFVQSSAQNNPEDLNAQALVNDFFSIAVFRDGTAYFAGALEGKYVANNGKTTAFRLPKLPEDFSYTHIAVSGSFLYAAWEESRFFETGRSGFLAVDLEKVLY